MTVYICMEHVYMLILIMISILIILKYTVYIATQTNDAEKKWIPGNELPPI